MTERFPLPYPERPDDDFDSGQDVFDLYKIQSSSALQPFPLYWAISNDRVVKFAALDLTDIKQMEDKNPTWHRQEIERLIDNAPGNGVAVTYLGEFDTLDDVRDNLSF